MSSILAVNCLNLAECVIKRKSIAYFLTEDAADLFAVFHVYRVLVTYQTTVLFFVWVFFFFELV